MGRITCPLCKGKCKNPYLGMEGLPCPSCIDGTIPDRRAASDRPPCPYCIDGVFNVDVPTASGGAAERPCHACRGTGWADRRSPTANDRAVERIVIEDDYSPGLLNDYGGGNVQWWQDYIRSEVNRCNAYWRDIIEQEADNG